MGWIGLHCALTALLEGCSWIFRASTVKVSHTEESLNNVSSKFGRKVNPKKFEIML